MFDAGWNSTRITVWGVNMGHQGPSNRYKLYDYNLYIGIIKFFHIELKKK